MGTLNTTDLWAQTPNQVGSDRHCSLIDKLAACQSEKDERLIQLREGGHTMEEIADAMGELIFTTEQRFRRIMLRANGRDSDLYGVKRGS